MMKKINKNSMVKRLFGTLLLLSVTLGASAAHFWQERIDTVSESGYHHIQISQEMSGLGLYGLKIKDQDNKEVPYLLRSSALMKEVKQMELYELVSHTKRDSLNTIVVHNTDGEISRFYLQMKTADVHKYITIRGSYNKKEWFSVKQQSRLYSEHNPYLGEVAAVDFPQGDYTYYELIVKNKSIDPLYITGVGKMAQSQVYGQFIELNPGVPVIKEDEDGNTVITFPQMLYPYYLSKLAFNLTAKGHYSRTVRIVRDDYRTETIQVTSREEPSFFFYDFPIDHTTRIIIRNENNPPLAVNDVKLYGLNRYLCAYLDAGVSYRVETSADRNPQYDIQNFASEIPVDLPIVKTGDLQKVAVEPEPERERKFFEEPLFLWSVIVFTGLVLLLITIRMLNELKKRE